MAELPDINALRNKYTKLKDELIKEWESTVDENGTFFFVFGNPKTNPYAVSVEVGYTEDEEIYADVQPVSEIEGGMEDQQLEELTGIVYTEAHHLDTLVAKFAHSIYDYLLGETNHQGFKYVKYAECEKLRLELERAKATEREVKEAKVKVEREKSREKSFEYWERLFAAAEGNPVRQMELLAQLKAAESKREGVSETDVAVLAHLVDASKRKAKVLSHTNFGTTYIPSFIKNLRHLQEANFAYNQIVVISQEVTELPNLRKLILAANKLKFLPPLSGLVSLEVLDCHKNEITALPADIGLLKKLQTIDMERNKIVVIPDEVANLKLLSYFNLVGNNVKLVPPVIGGMSKLTYLKLSHNPIVNLPPHIYMQGTQASLAYLREYIPDAAHITESSMVSDLAKFAKQEQFSDMILKPHSGAHIFAHKIMIDARCPVMWKQVILLEENPLLKQLDSQGRIIVPIDLPDDELDYLISFIYGDNFIPPQPQLTEISADMTSEEREQIGALNVKAMDAFSKLCHKIGDLGAKYCLPRLQKLALVLVQPSVGSSPTTYFSDFERFCLKPKHSDVSFMVDGRTILTHKLLLCARSEYFRNMLTGGLLESTLEIVPLFDVQYQVIRSIFEFCYTDDLTCTSSTIMDLLMSSRVYGLERLKGLCESVVGYSLDVDNAPGIYSISDLYSFKRLKKACKYFILSNWHAVTTGDPWKDLEPKLQQSITRKAEEWKII